MRDQSFRIQVFTILIITGVASVQAGARDGEQLWTRATILLEPAPSLSVGPEQTLIPGGVCPTAGLSADRLAAFDRQALARIERLYSKIRKLEETMRLDTLMVRQYHVKLPLEGKTALPSLDLNPRLGTSLSLTGLTPEVASMEVVFHYARGVWETPEFTGDPITIALQDADVRVVLGAFAQLVDKEIIIDPEVEGSVAVDFRDVPWDEAFALILRISGLGYVMDGEVIRVSRLSALNQRREVLAQAVVAVGRGADELAMVAGRNGHETPTVVLMVEPLEDAPPRAEEHASMVRFTSFQLPESLLSGAGAPGDRLVVVRGTVTTEGELKDARVLRSPSQEVAEVLAEAATSWRLKPVLDRAGHHQEVVVAVGVRLEPARGGSASDQFGFEVTVRQDRDRSDGKLLDCRLTDLGNGESLVTTRVHCVPGGGGSARASFVRDGVRYEFEFEVEVGLEGRVSTYYWRVVSGDGKTVASQRASMDL